MRPCGRLERLCNLYLSGLVWAFSIVLSHNGCILENNKEPDQISLPARLHLAAGLVEYSTVNGQFKDCFFLFVCLSRRIKKRQIRLDPLVVRLWLEGQWFDPWVKLQYAGYWSPVVQMVISADDQLEHSNVNAAIFQMNLSVKGCIHSYKAPE